MRRVLVVTWALGTATGVLLGLFGVDLVSSRFSTAGVSPLSRPEVLRALQAARSVPPAPGGVALSTTDTTAPQSPAVDAGSARPSAGPTSSSAPAPPASPLPRPGATAETFVEASNPPSSTTSTAPPPAPPTTTTTAPPDDGKAKPKSDSKTSGKSSTSTSSSPTTTTTSKKTTATTAPPKSQDSSPQSDTRTISSAGGVVAVRYSGGKVELKWARPNPGYQVYVRSNGPDQVAVYFYTNNRVSQVVAYYDGNTPAQSVQECSSQQGNGRLSCR